MGLFFNRNLFLRIQIIWSIRVCTVQRAQLQVVPSRLEFWLWGLFGSMHCVGGSYAGEVLRVLGLLQENGDVLRELRLSRCGLLYVPRELSGFSNLTHLQLHSNKLVSLPEAIAELKSLQELRVDHNLLIDIPAWVWAMPHLVRLHASHNQVTQLPSVVPRTCPLIELDVSHNRIVELSDTLVASLRSLRVLDVSYNALSVVPPALHRLLPRLVSLRICGNALAPLFDGSSSILSAKSVELLSSAGSLPSASTTGTAAVSARDLEAFAIVTSRREEELVRAALRKRIWRRNLDELDW